MVILICIASFSQCCSMLVTWNFIFEVRLHLFLLHLKTTSQPVADSVSVKRKYFNKKHWRNSWISFCIQCCRAQRRSVCYERKALFLFQLKFLYLYLPLVCTFHSECVTVEGPKPDGVPDREHHGPMKLLQFHENYRPAYWGTWSKKSSHISPRCPLRQDKVKLFWSQYG